MTSTTGALALAAALVFALAVPGAAQLRLQAVADDGVVLLRWTPGTLSAFDAGTREGYLLERRPEGAGAWDTAALIAPVDFEVLRRTGGDEHLPFFLMAHADAAALNAAEEAGGADANDREDLLAIGLLATVRSRATALASGLFYVDSLPMARRAEYRVRRRGGGAASNVASVDPRLDYALPPVDTLEATFGNRLVELSWRFPEGGAVVYLDLQRRVGADSTWTDVNDAPYLPDDEPSITRRDSLRDNATAYAYRVVTHDAFHRSFANGPEVRGRGLPPVNIPAPFVESLTELPDSLVRVTWSLDERGDASELTGVQVFRAYVYDGTYLPISPVLAPTRTSYVDSVIARTSQFYRVVGYDALGRRRRSAAGHFIATDSVPPSVPVNLRYDTVGYDGVVRLAWDESPESDTKGYRVFYASSRGEGAGVRLTNYYEPEAVYVDSLQSLRSLSDSIYYRVISLDLRGNLSDFSEVLAVPVPDVVAPAPALLGAVTSDTLGVYVAFQPSGSHDAALYEWQHRPAGTNDFVTFGAAAAAGVGTRIIDSVAPPKIVYEYRVLTYDEAGNRAVSNVVRGERLWTGVLPGVRGLSAKLDADAQRMVLQWRYGKDDRLRRFRIYRAPKGRPLQTLELISSEDLPQKGPNRRDGSYLFRYYDTGVALGEEYDYAVQAEWADGSRSRVN